MKSYKFFTSILVVFVVMFASCEKENEVAETTDLSITESVALEASIEEVEDVMDQSILYSGGFLDYTSTVGKGDPHHFGFFNDCVIIEMETTDVSMTINIIFEEDCTDRRGNAISGAITIIKSMNEASRERSITFQNFSVNGYVVNGSRTFTYTPENENGNPQMSGMVDISIETEEGMVTKQGNRTVEVTAGADTDTWSDNELTVTASFEFTNASGASFSLETTTPLVKPAECHYFASGVKEYTNAEGTAVLDYGDGTCDNVATLTKMDGTVVEIELRKGRRHHKG